MVFLLSAAFIPANPPGGVLLVFYLFGPCIPVGAFLYARYKSSEWSIVFYSPIAGTWFAIPAFTVVYEPHAFLKDAPTVESQVLKVGLFALATYLVCSYAFAAGRRCYNRNQTHDA